MVVVRRIESRSRRLDGGIFKSFLVNRFPGSSAAAVTVQPTEFATVTAPKTHLDRLAGEGAQTRQTAHISKMAGSPHQDAPKALPSGQITVSLFLCR
jgi:hypothetical protein